MFAHSTGANHTLDHNGCVWGEGTFQELYGDNWGRTQGVRRRASWARQERAVYVRKGTSECLLHSCEIKVETEQGWVNGGLH